MARRLTRRICASILHLMQNTMKRFTLLALSAALLINSLGAWAAETGTGAPDAKAAASESFQIRNQKFGDLLRPEDASGANGARIVLYSAQLWKCMTWKLHPAGAELFQVQNHFTSKTFAAKDQGAPLAVVQSPWSRDAKERPAWRFTKLPDGLYQITDPASGKALTADSAGGGGVRIVLAPWQKQPEQKWELLKTDPAKLTM